MQRKPPSKNLFTILHYCFETEANGQLIVFFTPYIQRQKHKNHKKNNTHPFVSVKKMIYNYYKYNIDYSHSNYIFLFHKFPLRLFIYNFWLIIPRIVCIFIFYHFLLFLLITNDTTPPITMEDGMYCKYFLVKYAKIKPATINTTIIFIVVEISFFKILSSVCH